MNSLSWLLYAADVFDTLRTGGAMLGVVLGVGAAVAIPFSLAAGDTYSWMDAEEKKAVKARPAAIRAVAAKVFVGAGILLLLATLAPSRNTIMLIAASEVGETVLASTEAQQIGGEAGALAADSLRVLRKFINDQLADGEE